MPAVIVADDLALALELADVADAITLQRFGAADLAVDTKPDMTPVTESDRAVERALRDLLSQRRPGDGFLGEEYGELESGGGRRWIVDPIDGTKSYVRGVPVWATLVGLQDGDELIVGVCSAPALGRRWWASRGGGAWARGPLDAGAPRHLGVSGVTDLADAQLSLNELEEWLANGRLDGALELASRCWRIRSYGDFWPYMMLAEGAIDIAIDPAVSPWDMAATIVIVREAGGRLTDLEGVETAWGGDALATNGRLHEAVLGLVGR